MTPGTQQADVRFSGANVASNGFHYAEPAAIMKRRQPLQTPMKKLDSDKLDRLVASARADYATRENGYRQRALKLYPWICGRCMREFNQANLQELTVHHRDHNHDNNPNDGSNWELLCVYCHDNEHQRHVEQITYGGEDKANTATHNPFADLKKLLDS